MERSQYLTGIKCSAEMQEVKMQIRKTEANIFCLESEEASYQRKLKRPPTQTKGKKFSAFGHSTSVTCLVHDPAGKKGERRCSDIAVIFHQHGQIEDLCGLDSSRYRTPACSETESESSQ
ncbi:hypothetical protein NPIL_474001 [Nephila pilipes]|uniref:Uncharacterized protein n=1 Tax=Nephila pilipes TaxID=299642 RepID=A0A8X6NP42_NEPPI|nr:hypothetical protein NPIL_474001 [Nephila pilipes]